MNIRNEVGKFGLTGMPERYRSFAQEVCQLAKKYKFNEFHCELRPGFGHNDWPNPIHINWSQGRHGADNNEMRISSNLNFTLSIQPACDQKGAE